MSRSKLWAGLIVLFVAGVVTGIVGTCLYHEQERGHRWERGPAAQQERMMKRLTRELSLTAAQQAEIEPIVTRAHVALLELRSAHQSEVDQILARGVTDIKEKLSAEQQAQLDKMVERLQQRWKKSLDYLDMTKKRLAWLHLAP